MWNSMLWIRSRRWWYKNFFYAAWSKLWNLRMNLCRAIYRLLQVSVWYRDVVRYHPHLVYVPVFEEGLADRNPIRSSSGDFHTSPKRVLRVSPRLHWTFETHSRKVRTFFTVFEFTRRASSDLHGTPVLLFFVGSLHERPLKLCWNRPYSMKVR